MHKKIWIDNTMPPTDHIWMKTDLKNILLGIYAWINGDWRRIDDGSEATIYTKAEVDKLLLLFEREIAKKLKDGGYEVGIQADARLSSTSKNPVQNKVIKAALDQKQNKIPDIQDFVRKATTDLVNYYLKSEVYTKEEIQALFNSFESLSLLPVDELPEASASCLGKIYLVPSIDPKVRNAKDEYVCVANNGTYSWEQIGSTAIDLDELLDIIEVGDISDLVLNPTDYYTKTQVDSALATKQNALISGTNIKTINNQSLLGEGNITIEGGSGGDVNIIETIKVNNSALPVNNKTVNITVPTSLSALSDDATHRLVTDLEKQTWSEKYSKPSTGIPATDLASGVIPDVSGFYTKPNDGIPSTDLSSDVQASLEKADTALQSFTETDPTVPSWAKASDKPTYDYSEITNTPSIPAVPTPESTDNGKVLGVTDANGTMGWVPQAGGGGSGSGTVTSVAVTVPTGLSVSGSPITTFGTIAIGLETGYSIPTTAKQGEWDAKYDKPSGGIPDSDLSSAVQTSLGKADTAIQSSDLATVATTGSYTDLLNTPTIPSAQVQSDWGENNSSDVDYIKNRTHYEQNAVSGSIAGDTLTGTYEVSTTNALTELWNHLEDSKFTFEITDSNSNTYTATKVLGDNYVYEVVSTLNKTKYIEFIVPVGNSEYLLTVDASMVTTTQQNVGNQPVLVTTYTFTFELFDDNDDDVTISTIAYSYYSHKELDWYYIPNLQNLRGSDGLVTDAERNDWNAKADKLTVAGTITSDFTSVSIATADVNSIVSSLPDVLCIRIGTGNPQYLLNYSNYSKTGNTRQITYSGVIDTDIYTLVIQKTGTSDATYTATITSKQNTLVSGTSIKTINNESILGSGNISISSGSADAQTSHTLNGNVRLTSNWKTNETPSGVVNGALLKVGAYDIAKVMPGTFDDQYTDTYWHVVLKEQYRQTLTSLSVLYDTNSICYTEFGPSSTISTAPLLALGPYSMTGTTSDKEISLWHGGSNQYIGRFDITKQYEMWIPIDWSIVDATFTTFSTNDVVLTGKDSVMTYFDVYQGWPEQEYMYNGSTWELNNTEDLIYHVMPTNGLKSYTIYNLGILTGTVSFTLDYSDPSKDTYYYWTFSTSTTAPTITWPSQILEWKDGAAPTITANSTYEVMIHNGTCICVSI